MYLEEFDEETTTCDMCSQTDVDIVEVFEGEAVCASCYEETSWMIDLERRERIKFGNSSYGINYPLDYDRVKNTQKHIDNFKKKFGREMILY